MLIDGLVGDDMEAIVALVMVENSISKVRVKQTDPFVLHLLFMIKLTLASLQYLSNLCSFILSN